jgi:heat shock protein HtpX
MRLKQENEESRMPDSMLAFGIRQGKKASLGQLLSSHPALDDRIDALRRL